MDLSKRLQAVASLVQRGTTAADIGTDHAYVPVHLVRSKAVPRAIAMDINEGPLLRAKETVRSFGLEDVIEIRLSDGLEKLRPGEAGCIIIAGMGGPLTIRILERHPEVTRSASRLVLQPQSEIRQVRAWLFRQGMTIIREDMVLEDGKYYPMMNVCTDGASADIPGGGRTDCSGREDEELELMLRYGPLLLKEKHPILHRYLLKEKENRLAILQNLRASTGDRARIRRETVEEDLELIRHALEYFGERVYEDEKDFY